MQLHVRACNVYAADNPLKVKPKASTGHLLSGVPWDTLAIDYLGPFPLTSNGHRFIMVLTDHFTKYAEVILEPSQRADICAMRIA